MVRACGHPISDLAVYLVDTNVISAAAPSISKLRREGATRKSADLTAWLETVLHLYADRVLAFDVPTARIAGTMADRARGQGHAPGLADIIVAATAQQHGLTILSRNLRHIEPLGVNVLDPFARLPPAPT